MRIGIIGSGNVGANIGTQLARAGHEVLFSFSRDESKLAALASGLPHTRWGTPATATAFGDVVVLSVPWTLVDDAIGQAGDLSGKVVADTTNQFGRGGWVELPGNVPAAVFNAGRMPGARLVKAFNTYTAQFQRDAPLRAADRRPAMFYAGQDAEAKHLVATLIGDAGFVPVDLGGWEQVRMMEAPRRPGAVYGEEYTPADAERIAAAARSDPAAAAKLAATLKQP